MIQMVVNIIQTTMIMAVQSNEHKLHSVMEQSSTQNRTLHYGNTFIHDLTIIDQDSRLLDDNSKPEHERV